MEVLRCGHCNFQTEKIKRLESHLKAKHTAAVKDNDSDAEFIDLEEELFHEMESDSKSNSVENSGVQLQQKSDSAVVKSLTPSGTNIPGPELMSTDTQNRIDFNRNNIKSEAAFRCNICDFSADSRRTIGVHKFKSHGFQKISKVISSDPRCHQCPFVGSSSVSLKIHQHRKGHLPNPDNSKSVISQTPSSSRPTVKDVQSSDEDLQCSKCPFVGSSHSSLQNHVYRTHKRGGKELDRPPSAEAGDAKFHCPECGFVGWNRKSLTTHIFRSHKANAASVFTLAANVNEDGENRLRAVAESRSGAAKLKRNLKIPEKPPIPTTTFKQLKTEVVGDSFKSETKPVLMKTEAFEVSSDILKDFIRCPACQFMCNSLRSMGEHVAAVHSAGVNAPAPAVKNDAIVDAATVNNVTFDDNKTNDVGSGETKDASGVKTFQCSECDIVYFRRDSLRRHCKQRHEGQGHQSPPKILQPPVKEEIVAPVRPVVRKSKVNSSIPCPACKVKFSSNSNLKRHRERFHPALKVDDGSAAADAELGTHDDDADVEIIDA